MVTQKLKDIVKNFQQEMKNKKVPFYVVGIVLDRNNNPALEIVIERPQRYNVNILKRVPKAYHGLEVHTA